MTRAVAGGGVGGGRGAAADAVGDTGVGTNGGIVAALDTITSAAKLDG